jgi:hypothetical protein
MKVSSQFVRTVQAQRLLCNVDSFIERYSKHTKAVSDGSKQFVKKFIQAIDTILQENAIDEDLLERLRTKRIRLELIMTRLIESSLVSELPRTSEGAASSEDVDVFPTSIEALSKISVPKTSVHKLDDERNHKLDDSVSAQKIHRLLQDQKVHRMWTLIDTLTDFILL